MIKRYLIITAILLTNIIFSYSQSATNSPYTRFGIGEIDRNGFNHSKAMGGISTGLRTRNQINYMNPAAISAQDTMSFIFDIGISGINKNLKTDSKSDVYEGISFDHIALSFPVTKWWFASAGVTPYSKIGYHIQQISDFDEEIKEYNTYYGNGGINQVFISNSFKFLQNFSFGFNFNYLFGSIEQYDQIYLDRQDYYCTVMEELISLENINFDFGFQYYNTIFKDYFLVAGIVYSNKTTFNTSKQNTILMTANYNLFGVDVEEYLYNYENVFDTISSVVDDNYKVEIPAKYSIGFTVGQKNKFAFGVDYSYQNWTNVASLNNDVSYDTDQRISLGLEYTPNLYDIRNYLKKVSYRAGFYYNNSYLTINNKPINNYGITFGLGLPLGNQRTSLNVSYTYGKRGTTDNGLIEEKYSSFGINLTLYDFWFIKRKFQ